MGEGNVKRYKVLLLDTKGRNPNHYICLALRDALAACDSVEQVVYADAFDAVHKAETAKCNLFIAFDGEELDFPLCQRLAALCGNSVLWVTEDPYEIHKNKSNAAIFDLVFTNDSGSVPFYGKKGRHLALAAGERMHYFPIIEDLAQLRYDAFFAGTAWPNRVELIRNLLDEQSRGLSGSRDLKLKLALPSNEHLPPVDLPLPASMINWRMSVLDFSRFANMSLATLVLPRVFSASGNKAFAETPPPRLFEAALAGTVQLVESTLAQAVDYFSPGTEFLYFDNARHLLEQLQHLRNKPELRFEIATRAQQRAMNMHCYRHRAETILSELAALKESQSTPAMLHVEQPPRPKILLVTHNILGRGHFGGVEVYLANVQAELRDEYEVYFYTPGSEPGHSAQLLDADCHVVESLHFRRAWSSNLLCCDEREDAFGKLLVKYGFSVVHFHHLINHVPSMIEVARFRGAKVAFTFHDYYAACKNFTLIDFRGKFCQPDSLTSAQCDVCLSATDGLAPGAQASRRAFFDRIMASVDYPVFNTEGGRKLCSNLFPLLARNQHVQVNPVALKERPVASLKKMAAAPRVLNVAVLGNFTRYKGADVVLRAAASLRGGNVRFYIFGRVDADYRLIENEADFPNVHVVGEYSPDKLPEELANCDVSLHLSIWPETYCLTLSEAWAAGLVPIVADIGALGERVTHGANGFKIKPQSEGALIELLLQLSETPKMLAAIDRELARLPVSQLETHVAGLKEIYKQASGLPQLACKDEVIGASNIFYLNRPWNSLFWGQALNQPMPALPEVLTLVGGGRPGYLTILANYYRAYGFARTVRRAMAFVLARLR